MKPAMRIAALSHIPSIWIYTHDSIGLGEDGPTHQPIEQLMTLRATPTWWCCGLAMPMRWRKPGVW